MKNYFLIINSVERAWMGLLAAMAGGLLSTWLPPAIAIPILVVVLPVGLFAFGYLGVYSFWPATLPYRKKTSHWLKMTVASVVSRNRNKETNSRRSLSVSQSTAFFAQRFAEAFPGLRKTTWFEGKEAIKRLKVLLRDPLVFEYKEGTTTPIWWWRDGNFHIPAFRILKKGIVLLDTKELKVKRIAAVPSEDDFRKFIYLEAAPMSPCGAYDWSEEKIQGWVNNIGYAKEEYGLYRGRHIVSRAEYDDNGAEVRGRLVKLGDDVELRERYLTSYNLVIAPHLSPINNGEFDFTLRDFMDRMIKGHADIAELEEMVRQLPMHRALEL